MLELLHDLYALFVKLHSPEALPAFAGFIGHYGLWTYAILFAIIFCETGLVVTPFLPGDSLLFAAGAMCATGKLDAWQLFLLLSAAAILGDTINYQIGHYLGPKVLNRPNSRIFKKEYLDRTHAFFEKYGGKTIIIARFVPWVRTFAPFVAGVGAMTYWRFLAYNVIGGLLWVAGFVFLGKWFGEREIVKNNFALVIYAIIFLSILPIIIEFLKHRRQARAAAATLAQAGAPEPAGDGEKAARRE